MIGFEKGKYDLSLIVENLFDKRYAVEVTKDTSGEKDYTPAAPRFVMARLTYKF
jgi:iron complex outermembrane receptor protein